MRPDPLPANLRDLEERLAKRSVPGPTGDFRARVLTAMVAERASAPSRRWRRIGQVAAAIVVILNIAMSIANGVRYQRLPRAGTPGVHRPRVVDSPGESDRLATLTDSALATLTPGPDSGAISREYFRNVEGRKWASP